MIYQEKRVMKTVGKKEAPGVKVGFPLSAELTEDSLLL